MNNRRLDSILDNLIDCLDTLSSEFGDHSQPTGEYLDLHYHARDLAKDVDERVSYADDLAVGVTWFVESYSYETALTEAQNVADHLQTRSDSEDFRITDDRDLE